MATVSTLAIRNLAARMANATDASVKAARDSVVASAEQMRDAIGGSSFLSLWDPEGPERKVQQQNLTQAINSLKASKDIESIKKNLLYLQATIEVSRTFYGKNEAAKRAFAAFIKDVQNAPALLVENVIAPVVKGAAVLGGKTIWAIVKGLWPILLLILAIVIGYAVVTRRLSR